jgi:transcriptional regulator GlxA family with amidase domain
MTAASGLAPRTFKRRFEAATGYAPLAYALSLRIEEAKQMLETTDAPIEDVAGEVGYVEAAAFRRVFKRATGISPHEYRKRFRWISPAARSETPAGPACRHGGDCSNPAESHASTTPPIG